jgi:surfeit locus 1 family protein
MSQKGSIGDLIWPAIFTLAAVAIFISLGVWQLHRREWKLDLIQRIESRSRAEPVSLDRALEAAARLGPAQFEYSRVKLQGRFDHGRERHLYALLDGAPGWRIITPLETSDGHVVLVDRGFVPMALKEPQSRPQGQIPGEVTLTGVVRAPGAKDWLGPQNDAGRNAWYWRDLEGMSAYRGKPGGVVPFFVELDGAPAPGGWPKSGAVNVQLPNRHLEYALTWFALAATAVGVFGALAYSRRRGN